MFPGNYLKMHECHELFGGAQLKEGSLNGVFKPAWACYQQHVENMEPRSTDPGPLGGTGPWTTGLSLWITPNF